MLGRVFQISYLTGSANLLWEGSRTYWMLWTVFYCFIVPQSSFSNFKSFEWQQYCTCSRWIIYLARKGIKELYFQFHHGVLRIYKVSSCLFSCKQLKVFVLSCYVLLVPHTYKDHMNLVHIDLKVFFLTEGSISYTISCCPLLETLKLEYRNFLTHLKIYATKLKSLRVRGSFKNIFLDGCSQLTDCKIYLLCRNRAYVNKFVNIHNLGKVFGCLPLLEELAVGDYFLRVYCPSFKHYFNSAWPAIHIWFHHFIW